MATFTSRARRAASIACAMGFLVCFLPGPVCARAATGAGLQAPAVPASPDDAPGFAEALAIALDRAPELQASRSRVAAARQDLGRAGALPDPRLMAGIDGLPVGGDHALDMDADPMTMRRLGLSQRFPAAAERDAARAVARATLEQARAGTVAERLAVQREAARAWIALWAALREQALLQALVEQGRLAERMAEARLQGGTGSASDALAVRSAALALDNRIAESDAQVEAARASLARWIGAVASVPSDAAPDFGQLPVAPAELLARLDDSAELLAWDAREASARAALAMARAERRPDWTVSGGYAQRGAGASDVVWLEASVGLTFLTRDRQDHGIAARSAALEAVQSERDAARRTQAERIHRLHAEWEGLGVQLRRLEAEILPLAGDRTRTALAAYGGGAALQPWLDARRDELEAGVVHARLLGRRGQAWAELAFLLPATEGTP